MIDPKQALEDAATHIDKPGAKHVFLTEDMIRHWQADALEAAIEAASEAWVCPEGFTGDSPMDAIRKLKEQAQR